MLINLFSFFFLSEFLFFGISVSFLFFWLLFSTRILAIFLLELNFFFLVFEYFIRDHYSVHLSIVFSHKVKFSVKCSICWVYVLQNLSLGSERINKFATFERSKTYFFRIFRQNFDYDSRYDTTIMNVDLLDYFLNFGTFYLQILNQRVCIVVELLLSGNTLFLS